LSFSKQSPAPTAILKRDLFTADAYFLDNSTPLMDNYIKEIQERLKERGLLSLKPEG
jgi:hypothetical protein